ncbi:MAG: phosphohydrolase, partial [Polaribacter sp.]|nr:phosphohydrolase [Polaribacter sp.]
MSNIVNKLYQNNSIIYKVILFLVATVAIVYLFPKGGQFKYDFTNGQLWKYDNLYAPFDFAIQKSAEEITKEKKEIEVNSKRYFLYDFDVEKNVTLNYNEIISLIRESDSLALEEISNFSEIGRKVIASIYKKGFLDVVSQDRGSNKNEIVAIRKGNEVEDVLFKSFLTSKEVLELINKSLVTAQNLYGKKRMLDLLSEIIKPNVSFDVQYSQKVLENEIKNISYTKGKIVSGKLIIQKGDIVEGKKLAILNSLKSESESQVWTESNYYWIILGYTILVSIALLMLLLFLKKYRVEIYENNNKVTFIFFNVFSMIFIQTLVIKFNSDYLYVVPLSILPIVLKAFFDPRLGLFTHVLTVLLLGYIVPDSFEFIYLHIIAGIVTILTVSELYKRANLFISVAQITLIYM